MKNIKKVSNEVRRKQIVGATLKIIAQKGLSGLTTAAIAREVGISEANLYRHFKSKDGIVAETVAKVGEGIIENVDKAGNVALTPLDRLARIFTAHLDYIEKNEGIPRLVFSEEIHAGDNKLKERLLNVIGIYSAKIEALIKDSQKNGSIRGDIDAKAVSLMFVGMIQVITLKWSLSGCSFPLAHEGIKLYKNFEQSIKGAKE